LRGQTMARARRRKQGQVDAGEGKVLVRAIIDVCPICQATPDTFAFPDEKVFQSCGSAIFSQNNTPVSEESDDDPSAPLSLLPRDRYRQAWHDA
jgi:hypothetical protein